MTGSAPTSVEDGVNTIALPVIGSTDLLARPFMSVGVENSYRQQATRNGGGKVQHNPSRNTGTPLVIAVGEGVILEAKIEKYSETQQNVGCSNASCSRSDQAASKNKSKSLDQRGTHVHHYIGGCRCTQPLHQRHQQESREEGKDSPEEAHDGGGKRT
jgi:hypothetical protein